MVNWSWHPTGGDWTYIENLTSLYKEKGHQVIALSTKNSLNIKTTDKEGYFIRNSNFKLLKKNFGNSVRVIKDSIVSFDALRQIDVILQEHDIAVAHLHNIHHYITPAIIWKLKRKGVKVIWTLHDYKIICPENSFVSNGKICEKCITGNFYNCAINKCRKGSYAVSFLAAVDAYFYHSTHTYNKVDAFLCPSKFILDKFRQSGIDPTKLFLTNLCYDIRLIDIFLKDCLRETKNSAHLIEKESEYILYVGRVEKIKGIKTLLDAVKGTDIKLKIAGTGSELQNLIDYSNTQNAGNVEFLGFQDKKSVFKLILNSKFSVCPSEWYENFPFSIIESFLFSKPVIGANLGGIPELVKNGYSGYLFEAGNTIDLRENLVKLWNNDSLVKQMGENALNHAFTISNFETHWEKLNTILIKIDTYGS